MTYKEALEKIHSLDTFGSRPGLDRIKTLLKEMGNPQDSLRFVHVAGTNGKGSTCALISSVLTAAGYKTGLFISPYITDFRERIQINGQMISRKALADAAEQTYPLLLSLRRRDCVITEFEYVTALAFNIYKEAGCDVVVLETGMGGLLDCTNVINPPLCSVITSIGLDHTAILGDTIEEIAEQKCGIIKPGSPVVASRQDKRAMQVILNTATEKSAPLSKSGDIRIRNIKQTLFGTDFTYRGNSVFLPLAGTYQLENAKTALAAIEVLSESLSIADSDIVRGFLRAVNPARFEILCRNPLVILDGAHNPDGVKALRSSLDRHINSRGGICVMGMLADKDSKSSVRLLKGTFGRVFTVPVNNPRSLSAAELARECAQYFDDVTACENPFEAFDRAYELAKAEGSHIVICGSLYLAGEIRPYAIRKTK